MTGTDWRDEMQEGDVPPPSGSETLELSTATAATGGSKRKRLIIAAAAAVAVIAIGAIAFAVTSGGPAKNTTSQLSPAQVLLAASRKSAAVTSLTATFTEQIGASSGTTVSATVAEIRSPLQMSMNLNMTLNPSGQSIRMSGIISGTTIYIKFGAVPGLPKAIVGKWLEIPLTSVPGSSSLLTLMQNMKNQNPTAQLALLPAAKHLRAVGTEIVDGVQTTKYTGEYVPAQALKLLPASERAALSPMLDALQGEAHFTVWIDGSQQVRKMVVTESVAGEPVTVSMNILSVNQPLTIAPPPANRVIHIPASALGGTS